MWFPYKILFVSLHILALPLHLFTFSCLILYKFFVRLVAHFTQDFVEPIPSSSAVSVPDNIWSRPHSSIIVGMEVDGNMTKDEATNVFQKLYDHKDQDGKICYRELGYYVVRFLGFGFWRQVLDFNISDRIHLLKREVWLAEEDFTSKTLKIHQESVESLGDKMLREPYLKDQPLWDVYILHNYNENPNKTLVLLRFHHVLADGMSFVKLLYCLTGSTKLPNSCAKPSNSVQKWEKIEKSIFVKIKTGLSLFTVGFIDYLNEVLFEHDKHAMHFEKNGKMKLTGNWICSMTPRLDLGKMKIASKFYRSSIVHIVLAGISNGVERYFHKYHGSEKMPEGFHFCVPYPIPNHPDMRLVNHWCLAKVNAKFGITEAISKLEYFKEEMQRCAFSSLPIISALTFKCVAGLLPVTLANLVTKGKATFTVLLSNIVGPQDRRRIGDNNFISEMFFFMPIVQESMALSIGMISCNGGARICLTGDTGCIPERSQLDDLGMMIFAEIVDICEMGETVAT